MEAVAATANGASQGKREYASHDTVMDDSDSLVVVFDTVISR
jgi:hypothetical protein